MERSRRISTSISSSKSSLINFNISQQTFPQLSHQSSNPQAGHSKRRSLTKMNSASPRGRSSRGRGIPLHRSHHPSPRDNSGNRGLPRDSARNSQPQSSTPHRPHPKSTQLCWQFASRGSCDRGDECRFLHEPWNRPGNATRTESQPNDSFNLKMSMKTFERFGSFATLNRFTEFLSSALLALNTQNRNLQSEAAEILSGVDSTGLKVVRYITETIGGNIQQDHPLSSLNFKVHVGPFIKIILHDVFTLTCIENNLVYLIKAMYGPDGERATTFLSRAISMLEVDVAVPDNCAQLHEGCVLVAKLFLYIVRFNADAIAQNEFTRLHTRLGALTEKYSSPQAAGVKKILSQIAPHIFQQPTVTHSTPPAVRSANPYASIERLVDLPGVLSRSGPRHDNDSHIISEIRILPTRGEFLSTRKNYLPFNDPTAPHHDHGAGRLFDIHFRLFREDMVGPLLESVSTSNLAGTNPATSHGRSQGMVTRCYMNVSVDSISFGKFQGPVIRLRFQQPQRWQSLKVKDRAKCWEATHSLDRDSLLCLIANSALECFLTVVEKDVKLLAKDNDSSFIDVSAADGHEQTLSLFMTERKDSLMIVEFPGVLLAAYKTVLENLQARSRSPYLPFGNLLCPTPDERLPYDPKITTVLVPPPLYSLSNGFLWDLSVLRRHTNRRPLFLTPHASPSDHTILAKLEDETTLDEGQCRGLVAGLTQELALIQGQTLFKEADRRTSGDRKDISRSCACKVSSE